MKTRPRKVRKQLTITAEAAQMGERMADSRGLSLSMLVEQLIREREMLHRGNDAQEADNGRS